MQRFLLLLSSFCLFGLISAIPVSAKIVINEFSSDTAGSASDPDWVELYNESDSQVDLSQYTLHDGSTNSKSLSGTIESNGFVSVDWTNKLNKDTDSIQILQGDQIVDQVTYGTDVLPAPSNGQSVGRQKDGDGDWVVFASATKGSSNEHAQVVQVTATPTDIPTPSKTPTPTKQPTPTKTPSPTRTPSPTKKLTPTRPPTVSKSLDTISPAVSTPSKAVLGVKTATHAAQTMIFPTNTPKPSLKSSPQTLVASANNFRSLAFMGAGICMILSCGILIFQKYKHKIFK